MTPNYYPNIVNKQDFSNRTGFLLGVLRINDSRIGFRVLGNGAIGDIRYNVTTLDKWINVVGVYNGTSMWLYENGVIKNSSNTTPNIENSNVDITFGVNFNGSLDEVRIYNRSLSESEILALYNSSHPISGNIT
ncbi:MAG TPA: LamG domain-containing protein, partial [Bacteroidetes bacterium]|nr:LamG domain-containing protein [Bacteroidota bacterium]HEX04694.1 LamG domain-containing protein [Bacteroidota bacterium]